MRTWTNLMLAGLVVSAVACSNTMSGAEKDTEAAVERAAGAAETFDVKTSLIGDGRVDASHIDVDTISETKTVILRGSVPTRKQRSLAGDIAKREARGYRIDNQLSIADKG